MIFKKGLWCIIALFVTFNVFCAFAETGTDTRTVTITVTGIKKKAPVSVAAYLIPEEMLKAAAEAQAAAQSGETTTKKKKNESSTQQKNQSRHQETQITPPDASATATPTGTTVDIPVQVKKGSYFFIVLQDLNGNGTMDTNLLGLPKEPFGFGGYTGGIPKDMNQFIITVDADMTMEIPLL